MSRLFAIFTIILLVGCSPEEKNSNIDSMASLGESVFNKNCVSCHGVKGQGLAADWKVKDANGNYPPPPLNGTAHTWHHSPDQLFQIIRYGYKKFDPNYKGKMLGNDDLSVDDVWSILGYIKSIWPEEIRNKYNSYFGE